MKNILPILFLGLFLNASSQETSMLDELADSVKTTEKVYSIFKSTRVINAHAVDMLHKGNLDFRILHRFGNVDAGLKQFFGLDQASMRIGLDYGISNNFTIGIGRSTFRKELDLFGKIRILQQSTGAKIIPLSIVMAAGAMTWTAESFGADKPGFSERTSYYFQLLAGRKFTDKFSLQISPLWVHSKAPLSGTQKNIIAIGTGARYKISKRMALTMDYHAALNGLTIQNTNPLSVGIDIETGGHVFQLHFSNSPGMNERAYINETYDEYFKGEIRFGFNLSRIFQLGKR